MGIYKLSVNMPKKDIYHRIFEYEKLLKEIDRLNIELAYLKERLNECKCNNE